MRWLGAALVVAFGVEACEAVHEDKTRVFVRDPHRVWVEARSAEGDRVVLPAGWGFRGVSVRADLPSEANEPSYASVFREPSGGITLDHPSCAPWPTNPLTAHGELTVPRSHGDKGYVADGNNLRIPFRCEDADSTVIDLAFVTPLSNVREVHVIEEEDADEVPIVSGSTDPVLQAHPWEH